MCLPIRDDHSTFTIKIPYTAKLSRGKTCAVGEENGYLYINLCSRMLVCLCCQSIRPQIHGKTFEVEGTTGKPFSFKSFAVYNTIKANQSRNVNIIRAKHIHMPNVLKYTHPCYLCVLILIVCPALNR